MGRKKNQKAKGEATDRLPLFEGAATSEVGMPRVRSISSSSCTLADAMCGSCRNATTVSVHTRTRCPSTTSNSEGSAFLVLDRSRN